MMGGCAGLAAAHAGCPLWSKQRPGCVLLMTAAAMLLLNLRWLLSAELLAMLLCNVAKVVLLNTRCPGTMPLLCNIVVPAVAHTPLLRTHKCQQLLGTVMSNDSGACGGSCG